MGDRPDHVGPTSRRLLEQLLAAGERADALLRKRHYLQPDDVLHAIADFEQRVERL